MKTQIQKFIFLITFVFTSFVSFSQNEEYQKFKIVNKNLEGFMPINTNLVSETVITKVQKTVKKNIFENDTIKYFTNSNGLLCAKYINKMYEGTFIIMTNTGEKNQTIVCINPEFKESGKIYNLLLNSFYVISSLESPFGSVCKIITPSKTWFEVIAFKQEDKNVKKVFVFNSKIEQVAVFDKK